MTDKKITELNLKSATYYGAQLQMNHFTEELADSFRPPPRATRSTSPRKSPTLKSWSSRWNICFPSIRSTLRAGQRTSCLQTILNPASGIWLRPSRASTNCAVSILATAADPDMSKDEVQIKRQTANHDLETDIGELVSYLNWLAGRYSIAAEEIREIKSYKVQRTRDRIELETGSICKKVVDDKAVAQAQDLADYCKQQTECEPGGCIFATTGEGCILSDYVRPELWPDAIAKQQQEGQKNG